MQSTIQCVFELIGSNIFYIFMDIISHSNLKSFYSNKITYKIESVHFSRLLTCDCILERYYYKFIIQAYLNSGSVHAWIMSSADEVKAIYTYKQNSFTCYHAEDGKPKVIIFIIYKRILTLSCPNTISRYIVKYSSFRFVFIASYLRHGVQKNVLLCPIIEFDWY